MKIALQIVRKKCHLSLRYLAMKSWMMDLLVTAFPTAHLLQKITMCCNAIRMQRFTHQKCDATATAVSGMASLAFSNFMILNAMKSLHYLDKLHLVVILDPNLYNLFKMCFFLKCPCFLFRLMSWMLMYLVTKVWLARITLKRGLIHTRKKKDLLINLIYVIIYYNYIITRVYIFNWTIVNMIKK